MKQSNTTIPLLLFGAAAMAIGISAPWAGKDHYNFGGAFTSLLAKCYLLNQPFDFLALPQYCDLDPPMSYRNHPPGLMYLLGNWIRFFGEQEWVSRSLPLVFALLNILLMIQIGREAWKGHPAEKSHGFLTGFFYASSLGCIYFGTHLDLPGMPGMLPVLISALLALQKRWIGSAFFALLAACFSWTGFFSLLPSAFLAWRGSRQDRIAATSILVGGFVWGLVLVAFLQGDVHQLVPFFQKNILQNKYLPDPNATINSATKGPLSLKQFFVEYPIVLVRSYSRILSPLLCGLFFFGLWRVAFNGQFRAQLPPRVKKAAFLLGLPWLITSILGFQYVMVHVFWFMMGLPWMAFMLSITIHDCISNSSQFRATPRRSSSLKAVFAFCFVSAALYPAGIFKYNWLHDGLNSIAYLALTCAFLYWFLSDKRRPETRWVSLLCITAGVNVSQTINYRLEDPVAFRECRDQETHPEAFPPRAELAEKSLAHRFYCFRARSENTQASENIRALADKTSERAE